MFDKFRNVRFVLEIKIKKNIRIPKTDTITMPV